jgi:hypothetical protein
MTMIDIPALSAAAWSLTLICAVAIVLAAAMIGRTWLTGRRQHLTRPQPAGHEVPRASMAALAQHRG